MNVFIIDDHQMILDWYVSVISDKFNNWAVVSSTDVSKGIDLVNGLTELNLIIVDYKLGNTSKNGEVVNGVDFVKMCRKKFPNVKVILITGHEEILLIYHIHKSAIPDGLMVKLDVNTQILEQAIQEVTSGERFYSAHAYKALQQVYKKELLLQELNINILLLLEKGFKIKEIGETLLISESAVNKRIMGLKQVFNVKDNGGLIKIVKEEGFV